MASYVVDSGAVCVNIGVADHPVVGLRGSRLLVRELAGDEPIVVIECVNSTPEPDGTNKLYHIRVDPQAYGGRARRDVWAAMASTWRDVSGKFLFAEPEQYCPAVES